MRPKKPVKPALRLSLPLVLVALLVGAGVAPSSADLIDDTYDEVPLEETLPPEQYWVVEMADQVKESLPQSDIPDPCNKAGPLLVKEWLEPGHYVDMVVPEFHMYVAPALTTFEDLTVHGGLFAMADLDITGDFYLAPQGIVATADGYVPGGITIDGTWDIDGTVIAGNGKRPVPNVDTQSGHFPEPREYVGEDGINGAPIHLIAQTTASTAAEGCFGPGKGSKGGNPCLPIIMTNPSGTLVQGGDGGDGGKFKLTLTTAAGGGSYPSGDYSGWADFMSDGTNNATLFLGNGGHGAHAIFSAAGPGDITAIGGDGGLSGWVQTSGFEVSFDTIKPYIANEPTGGNGGTALPMNGMPTDSFGQWFNRVKASSTLLVEGAVAAAVGGTLGDYVGMMQVDPEDPGPLGLGLNLRLACEGEPHYADPGNVILELLESLGYPWGPAPMGHEGPADEEVLWWITFVLQHLQDGEYIGEDGTPGYPAYPCTHGDDAPQPGASNANGGADSVSTAGFDEYNHLRIFMPDAGPGGAGAPGTKGGDAGGLAAHGGNAGDGLFFGGRGGPGDTGAKNTCTGGQGSAGGSGAQGGDAIGDVYDFCEEWEGSLTLTELEYEGLAITENVAESYTAWVATRWGELKEEREETMEELTGEPYEINEAEAEELLARAEQEWEAGASGTVEHSHGVTHEKGITKGAAVGLTWHQTSCAPSALVYAAGGRGGDAGDGGPGGKGSDAWATGGNGGRGFVRGGDGGAATATGGTGGKGGSSGIPGTGGEGCLPGQPGSSQGGAGGPGGTATAEGGFGGESFLGDTWLESGYVSPAAGGHGSNGPETEKDGEPGGPGASIAGAPGGAAECARRDSPAHAPYTYKNGHQV